MKFKILVVYHVPSSSKEGSVLSLVPYMLHSLIQTMEHNGTKHHVHGRMIKPFKIKIFRRKPLGLYLLQPLKIREKTSSEKNTASLLFTLGGHKSKITVMFDLYV